MKSENNHKDTDRSSKLSSSINDGQRLNHETLLSFKVTEGSGNGKYLLIGNLRDKNTGSPLQGMEVYFTADSPIKISNQTTNKAGSFSTNAQIKPGTGGTFKIQAHFHKLNHHDATDSKTIILKIRAEKPDTPLEDHGSRNGLFRDMLRRIRWIPKRMTLRWPFISLFFVPKPPIKFYAHLLFMPHVHISYRS